MIELTADTGPERTLLVGVQTSRGDQWRLEESLQELGELVRSAGGEVATQAVQRLESPTAPYYIGRGKAEELAAVVKKEKIQSVVFDDELSPAQARNLEKIFTKKVLDRTQLILDIFAQRAKSREGKLQIELAQLQYLLPRLTRMWTHLSRQSGGIGTRGPGETQLEVDRRRIQEKIARLERELQEVRKHRGIQRAARNRTQWPICALVGYTNAGKSTLMNRLTRAEVYAADQLFATLDPTIRQFRLPNTQKVLLTDTVGFLQKLPHHLVESFQATLEEVTEADVLIHVVDLTHPQFEHQMQAVETVLGQIHALGKQTLTVFNKIDRLKGQALVERMLDKTAHSVAISAVTGEGIDSFFHELERLLKGWRLEVRLRIPQSEGALLAEIRQVGRVLETRYEEDNHVFLLVHVPPQLQGRLKPYMLPPRDEDPGDAGGREAAREAVDPRSGSTQDL
jgi:GTP-binding protein HflX